MESEVWKDVPMFEGMYQVSSYGRIKSYKNGSACFIGRPDKDGYVRVILCGLMRSRYIVPAHRLVALMFVPNPESKKCINHKDFNRSNNHYLNLEWVTEKENTEHSKNNLFIKKGMKGECHPKSMFTNEQASNMRAMRESGYSYVYIANVYNAKPNTILQIIRKGYYLK